MRNGGDWNFRKCFVMDGWWERCFVVLLSTMGHVESRATGDSGLHDITEYMLSSTLLSIDICSLTLHMQREGRE